MALTRTKTSGTARQSRQGPEGGETTEQRDSVGPLAATKIACRDVIVWKCQIHVWKQYLPSWINIIFRLVFFFFFFLFSLKCTKKLWKSDFRYAVLSSVRGLPLISLNVSHYISYINMICNEKISVWLCHCCAFMSRKGPVCIKSMHKSKCAYEVRLVCDICDL